MGDDVALGVADGDGHVLGAADHHAFDDGLAAEVDVCRLWRRRVRHGYSEK
ncbi:MAG: hypothetical protein M5U18_05165 [Dehalococcoidia bacterium]|nr:hypothetical protein [Dehalococcoidia bacterium]